MHRRAQIVLVAIAATMGALAVLTASLLDKRLLDPDGFLGPAWVRLPLLLAGAFLADLLPRTLWGSRFKPRLMGPIFRARIKEHWTRERVVLVIVGIVTFYITYVSYRNLKSFLPAVVGRGYTFDRELHLIDRALFLGHEPAVAMHKVLGLTWSAQLLSTIYLWFLPLVPLALTAWLVWSRRPSYGYWFAISQCIAWSLGTASYYALPTVGPGFEYPWLYKDIADTPSTRLMAALQYGRQDVATNVLQDAVQSVAGFASLHCAITLLVAMMAQVTLKSRLVHRLLWANFAVTVVATIYFGWHYVADDVAGAAIAFVAFYIGGIASGHHFDRHGARRQESPSEAPAVAE